MEGREGSAAKGLSEEGRESIQRGNEGNGRGIER